MKKEYDKKKDESFVSPGNIGYIEARGSGNPFQSEKIRRYQRVLNPFFNAHDARER